jgi:hypothetical protein
VRATPRWHTGPMPCGPPGGHRCGARRHWCGGWSSPPAQRSDLRARGRRRDASPSTCPLDPTEERAAAPGLLDARFGVRPTAEPTATAKWLVDEVRARPRSVPATPRLRRALGRRHEVPPSSPATTVNTAARRRWCAGEFGPSVRHQDEDPVHRPRPTCSLEPLVVVTVWVRENMHLCHRQRLGPRRRALTVRLARRRGRGMAGPRCPTVLRGELGRLTRSCPAGSGARSAGRRWVFRPRPSSE